MFYDIRSGFVANANGFSIVLEIRPCTSGLVLCFLTKIQIAVLEQEEAFSCRKPCLNSCRQQRSSRHSKIGRYSVRSLKGFMFTGNIDFMGLSTLHSN